MIWDLAEKWKWGKIGVNDTVFYRTKVMVPMINYCWVNSQLTML